MHQSTKNNVQELSSARDFFHFPFFYLSALNYLLSIGLAQLGLGIWWKFGLSVNRLILGVVQLNYRLISVKISHSTEKSFMCNFCVSVKKSTSEKYMIAKKV